MESPADPFDLNAAVIRHSERDIKAFLAALAARLEAALPRNVRIDRRREKLFSGRSQVTRIQVDCPEAIFTLTFNKAGLRATRAKQVHGVTISTSELSVPQWLSELNELVATMADRSAVAGDVLHGFL